MADILSFRATKLPSDGDATELRSKILSVILHHIGLEPDGVGHFELVYVCLEGMNLQEELWGPAIAEAVFLLIRAGLLSCNTYNVASGVLSICENTFVRPSKPLRAFLSAEF